MLTSGHTMKRTVRMKAVVARGVLVVAVEFSLCLESWYDVYKEMPATMSGSGTKSPPMFFQLSVSQAVKTPPLYVLLKNAR